MRFCKVKDVIQESSEESSVRFREISDGRLHHILDVKVTFITDDEFSEKP